jgi:tetratricopeptide (TPR) repeat protein
MKQHISAIVLLLMFLNVDAQERYKSPGDSIPWEVRKNAFIYNTARQFNDPLITRMAIYNLISENPSNLPLYDSLALSYYQYNQFASAALVSQQALQMNPNNEFALDVAANSFERIGALDRALNYYEKMYLNSNNTSLLYKIAFLQLDLERYEESNASLDQIIADPKSKEIMISFPMINDENKSQDVPLDVAAHRVKGMIEASKGNVEGAKAKYIEVLNMYPGFQLVQRQIQELDKQ